MALKNKSMYAILGILNITPSTGYDIKKYSDEVLAGFWNENFGHIYPTLKKMLDNGMIEVISGETGEKKILYAITEKGKQELQLWLMESTEQQPVRSEFMLKLLFSSNRPKEEVISMLEDYKKSYVEKLNAYQAMLNKLESGIQVITDERTPFIRAVLRRGIISDEAVVKWCDETIKDMEAE